MNSFDNDDIQRLFRQRRRHGTVRISELNATSLPSLDIDTQSDLEQARRIMER